MHYLIYGNPYLVKGELAEINKKLSANKDWQTFDYDATEIAIIDVIEQANSAGFFSTNKTIILRNCYFLGTEKVKLNFENNLDKLEQYLLNPNPETNIIFIYHGDKLNEKSGLVKLLKKKAEIKSFPELTKDEFPKQVRKMLTDNQISISQPAITEFISRLNLNLERAVSEVEKLKCYELPIDIEEIKSLVTADTNYTIFNLADALVNKNLAKAMNIYKLLLVTNLEPVSIISMIARQYRQTFQILALYDEGLGKEMIASNLKMHPYPVQLTIERSDLLDKEFLLKSLANLGELDIDIKLGDYSSRHTKLELFLLKSCL